MGKIYKFKTRSEELNNWLTEVFKDVMSKAKILVVIDQEDQENGAIGLSYFHSDLEQLRKFNSIVNEAYIDKFFCQNINKYIEYVEE